MSDLEIYGYALALSLCVFAALWPISVAMRDVSIVDAWWGPGFFGAALLTATLAGALDDGRVLLTLALVGVWSIRLGFVLLRRRVRHGAEDGRYVAMRRSWGATFWWKSFFVVFLLQGFLQWVIAITALGAIVAPASPLGGLAYFGAALAVIGFAIEAKADAELDAFKRTASHGDLLTTGTRRFVRHPNYVGEMIFWWGVWLIAFDAGAWWTVFAPVTLCVLLIKVSGGGITADYLRKTKPAFRDYAARTPAFLPRFNAATHPAE